MHLGLCERSFGASERCRALDMVAKESHRSEFKDELSFWRPGGPPEVLFFALWFHGSCWRIEEAFGIVEACLNSLFDCIFHFRNASVADQVCRVPVFESVGLEPLSQLYIGTEELQLARFPCVLLLEHVPKPVASRIKLMKFLWNRVLLIETRPLE